MVKIFVNYRRGDTIATAGRVYDRLAKAFGRDSIFMDVDHIPAGVDFVGHLEKQISACDVLLALMGQGWLDAKDASGKRRLDDPNDFVALELAGALKRNIPLIPVLIDGAQMPPESELPEPIKGLSRRNAIEVRNTQFGSDIDRLIEKVRTVTGTRSRLPWLVAAVVLIAAIAGGGYFYQFREQLKGNPAQPSVATGPAVSPAQPAPANPVLPAVDSYCEQAKRVIAAVDTRFESMLGREFGASRVATVALSNWDDCLIFMENKFVDKRRYACSVDGFADLASAEKATDDAAAALKSSCLGKGWVIDRSFTTDGKRRTRVMSENSKTTITFAPSRPPTAATWRLSVNVE